MLSYRFYIRNHQDVTPLYVEIEEPIGWDACTFTLQRSATFDGLDNVYSDDLTFYGLAGDILFDAFNNYGFDAALDFKIEFYCDNTLNTTIENVINMLAYSRVGNETTVQMQESSFAQLFLSRYQTEINFGDALSIGGAPLTPIEPFNLPLHSKLIETTTILKELGQEIDTNQNIYSPLLYVVTSDQDGIRDVTESTVDNSTTLDTNSFLENDTIFSRTIQFSGTISINSFAHLTKDPSGVSTDHYYSGGYNVEAQVIPANFPTSPIFNLIIESIPGITSSIGLVNTFDISFTVVLNPGDRMRIVVFDFFEATFPGDVIHRDNKYTWLQNSQINSNEDSQIETSSTNAFMVYETFNRVCESMTDQLNSFRSNFFGRTNSSPQSYSTNGCGALISLTNGLNLRKMLDANGDLYPLTMSFLDLYTSFNAIFNLGARVESDGNGGYYIRVEPKEYFYDNSEEVFTATSPSAITTVAAIDKLYNDIEIGYQNWEIDNLNGIDEFNATHTYSLPLVNVAQRLELGQGNGVTSPFIAGGYAIEMTRRVQYQSNPTTDWQYDNNNFIICLNQIAITSDKYSNPPIAQGYAIGTVSERNENYISVTNLISPETAYNLRISPGNMIINWFKCLAPALLLKPIKAAQFQSGEGNYQMITQRIDNCSISNGTIVENQDVTIDVTKFSDIQLAALYTPVYISFDYPLDFGSFIAIKEKSNKLIRVECDDLTYFGFISELVFTPNDGVANFKILLSGCFKGGFVRTGFTDGFEIGTC